LLIQGWPEAISGTFKLKGVKIKHGITTEKAACKPLKMLVKRSIAQSTCEEFANCIPTAASDFWLKPR